MTNDLKKFRDALHCYRICQCYISMASNKVTIGCHYGRQYRASLSDLSNDDRRKLDYFMAEFGEYIVD